jgi:nucleotide-binding universal stress UspA family protein
MDTVARAGHISGATGRTFASDGRSVELHRSLSRTTRMAAASSRRQTHVVPPHHAGKGTPTMKSFERLVVPVDGSPAAQRGIQFAAELAQREGSAIEVCSVVDEIAVILPLAEGALCDPAPIMETIEHAADDNVSTALALLRAAGVTATGTTLRGTPAAEIDAFVRRRHADGIVLGTNGRDAIGRLFMGSITLALVRTSDVPVVTVHADDVLRAGPMLVAIDNSSASLAALNCAIERARATNATLNLLHVFEEHRIERYVQALGLRSRDARRKALTDAEDALDDAADRVRTAGIRCATELQFGIPAATIVSAAERLASSSVTIGTHGRGELARLVLGSVANEVIRAARVPVYVVHRRYAAALSTRGHAHQADAETAGSLHRLGT